MGVKIRQKPPGSGIYWLFINHNCRRKSKKLGRDKKLAQDIAKKIEAKLVLGEMNLSVKDEQVPTFGEYSEQWIQLVVPKTCKSSTVTDYASILHNHVIPRFGHLPVSYITRGQVKDFLMEKYQDRSQSTVKHIQVVLSSVLALACDDEIINVNHAQNLGRFLGKKKKTVDKEINPLSRHELSILLNTFKEHFNEHYPFVLCLSFCGLRLGECVALRWSDVDFQSRSIIIQRNISRRRIETPKNSKFRHVDMSMLLTETLWRLKREREMQYGDDMPEWIFINSDGGFIDDDHWRARVWRKALDKSELRYIRIHDLRHTYATLLIQAGESMNYVKQQLGHSSISVTVDIYYHYLPGKSKEAVDRLDNILDINSPVQEVSLNQSIYGEILQTKSNKCV